MPSARSKIESSPIRASGSWLPLGGPHSGSRVGPFTARVSAFSETDFTLLYCFGRGYRTASLLERMWITAAEAAETGSIHSASASQEPLLHLG
jgi:hypothetical protein